MVSRSTQGKISYILLALLAFAAIGALVFWLGRGHQRLDARIPGTDRSPGVAEGGGPTNVVLTGKLLPGPGIPAVTQGNWPQFRGPGGDGINRENTPLARSWDGEGPKVLWDTEVGEGYAGAAVVGGRVYLMDYDQTNRHDALRCLSFDDGREIWRFAYPVSVKRNHGMSRTVPIVSNGMVVAIGPKCHVVALDAETGALRWGMDLVRQFGATVPPWYAGQCPLVEGDRLILAPGGKEALLMAVDIAKGEVIWKTPNPHAWKMTHASIISMEVEGEPMFVYCADKGVVGVSAKDGRILWETTEWKISIATVPSPLTLDDGRVFLSGGYDAGAMMLRIKKEGETYKPEILFRTSPRVFGATQQTPVLYQDHIFGVRPDGKFTCLSTEGKVVWTSEGRSFGLGPFVLGDGVFYAVNDTGFLRVIEANTGKYNTTGQAQILDGRESWGPLALTSGRLLARDLTRLVCVEVAVP
jgi:outer membrane protein assembly factor BamB